MANRTPFLRNEIPYTVARPKNIIDTYVTFGGYEPDENDPSAPPAIDGFEPLGLTKIDLKMPRGGTPWRTLSAENYDEIKEVIPDLTDIEANMTYIARHRKSVLEACGFAGHRTQSQTRPVALMLRLPSPRPSDIPGRSLILSGVWLGDNPMAWDVESTTDMRISQDVPLRVARVTEIID